MPGDISRILKVKPLQRADLNEVKQELGTIVATIFTDRNQIKGLDPHKVEVNGVEYWSCRAKHLNFIANQRGMGDYRYLIESGSNGAAYGGVAVHTPRGDYRRVA